MTATAEDLGRIKGAAFREFVAWWESKHGEGSVPRDLSVLCPGVPDADALLAPERPALGILASAWYPAGLVHGVVDGTIGDLPSDRWDDVAAEAAVAIMQTNFRGVYKAVFGLLISPDRYLKMAQRLWSMHYDSGTATVTKESERVHLSTNRDWRGHHPFICRLNMQASRALYGAMGCQSIRVERLTCVSEGADRCESRVRWS